MSRPMGMAKTGGRVRGVPNKRTLTVAEKLDALGCDPLEGLARIAMNEKNAVEIRVRCYSELAQYVYPKRKAVDDVSSQERSVINVNTNLDNSGDSSDVRDKHQPEA